MARLRIDPLTIRDIAEAAGVSPSTVSRALNGSSDNSRAGIGLQRVRDLAVELGYVPNHAARALRGRRTSVVVLADDPTNEMAGATTAALETAALEGGFFVTAAAIGRDSRSQLSAARVARALRPKAIVVSSNRLLTSDSFAEIATELSAYRAEGGRLIATGRIPFQTDGIVEFDDREAGSQIARHLLDLGRTRFAILAGPRNNPAFSERKEGFLAVLDERGIPRRDVSIVHAPYDYDATVSAVSDLVSKRSDIDAILAVNDLVALAALTALRAAGRDVPAHIALAGIDGQHLTADVTPSLTTFAFPFGEVGRAVARLVAAPSEGRSEDAPDPAVVHGQLVVRQSTGGSSDLPQSSTAE